MKDDQIVRDQLLALLRGGQAYMQFDQAVVDFPAEHFNTRPPNMDYSPWHLLEHLRIAQWDILEFIRNPDHVSPEWPAGYWPSPREEADEARWLETLRQFRADSEALQAIVTDPATDLYAALPAGEKYNVLREILVVADHNAYHLGEFGTLRQVMGTWPTR